MNEQNTNITYQQVYNGARTIQDCAKTMQNIFESFNSSMKRVGADDVFVGDASETLGTRYNSLKTKFDNYIKLVDEFASKLTGAADATAQTEKQLEDAASKLQG
jgi:uncharacterized protein YukE